MVYFKKYILLFFITLYAFTLNASEEIISHTKILVVDGDTIRFNDKKIRLHGIDTPEMKQICKNIKDENYNCGVKARLALINLILNHQLKCSIHGTDKYKRLIATCFVKDININKWLVKEGWALAYRKYSKDYVAAELFAKNNKAGLWQGKFLEPWKWRKLKN